MGQFSKLAHIFMTDTLSHLEANGRKFRATVTVIALTALGLVFLQTDASVMDLAEVGEGYTAAMTVIAAFLLLARVTLDLVVGMVRDRWGTPKGTPVYKAVFARVKWRDIVTALFALALTSTSFTGYKTLQISSGGYDWDAVFIAWDRALFFGQDPWLLTHDWFPTANATRIIDHFYHAAFLPMVIGFLLCVALQDRPALRYTYMTCYLAGFVIVGMLMASSLSSAGPVYDGHIFGDGQIFGPLIDRLAAHQAEMPQIGAVRYQAYLLRAHDANSIRFGSGISAMPSMHIVLVLIWAFAAWHIHKALGIIMTAYAALIWLGSVHLGWHYFVDGLVSLAVMLVVWRMVGQWYGLFDPARQVIRATT